jgi:hypothetical protein
MGWTIRGSIFSSPKRSRLALEPTQPPIQWVPFYIPRVKRPGREVNHSPPSSAEVTDEWRDTSTPRICHHGVDRENLPLYISDLFIRLMQQTFRTGGSRSCCTPILEVNGPTALFLCEPGLKVLIMSGLINQLNKQVVTIVPLWLQPTQIRMWA